MSSLAKLPEITGFFCYSRHDDEGSKGKLSALREAIASELGAQLGRTNKNFRIFQDKEAIDYGKLWQDEIAVATEMAVFFIPIVTPRLIQSDQCEYEFSAFLQREKKLDRKDLIFPILYLGVPELEDESLWKNDPRLNVIAARQWVDWRRLRHLDINSTQVGEEVEKFCSKIASALRAPWISPEEIRAREEAARQAEQEERRKAEAEAQRLADEEARRKAEAEARRLADEEARRRAEAEAEARRKEEEARRRAEDEAKQRLFEQSYLGWCYENGDDDVAQDYANAAQGYWKAGDQGDSSAQYSLGVLYENGNGVVQDYNQAEQWYRKAADQGNANAQNNLGELYYFGNGVAQDYEQAALWYRKAAEQGDSSAQYSLGFIYENGNGVAQDYAQAAQWYCKAADQGNANAQYSLGALYENENGVTQDYDQAAQWYLKAADQGNASAQYALGDLYYFGKSVVQDFCKATKWYRKAAEQGNFEAQFSLGLNYEYGNGIARDYEQASQWYLKAADQGNASAQYSLGSLYEYGKGNYSPWHCQAGVCRGLRAIVRRTASSAPMARRRPVSTTERMSA